MKRKELDTVVTEFRTALVALVQSGYWFGVSIGKDFPSASCDDSSLLLAAHLTDNGFPGARRVHGRSGGLAGELDSHVWLDLNGTLIDITGSQFENYGQPEILMTEEDPFLATFTVEPEMRVADFRDTELLPKYHFYEAYEAILGRMETA